MTGARILALAVMLFGNSAVPKKAPGFRIAVLCYHRISKKGRSPFTIPPDVFEKQMRFLFEKGYTVLSLRRLVSYLRLLRRGRVGKARLPRKAVVITFDDNYTSVYKVALPILRKYRFSATNFVYTRFMTAGRWRIYRRLSPREIDIQSHTHNHVDLAQRLEGESDTKYKRRLFQEMRDARVFISKKLGREVRYLAYPYGTYNKTVIRIARLSGYWAMFSALGGYVTASSRLEAIPRFTMFRDFDLKKFERIVSGRWHVSHKVYQKRRDQFRAQDYNFDL